MPLRNHRCERKGRGGRQQESLRERRAWMRLRAPSSIVTVRRNVPILSSLRLTARCVLYYNTILARGPAGRVPVASPRGYGAPVASSHLVAPAKRIAVLSLAGGDFALLLHHHRPRGLRSPMDPSIKGEKLPLPSEHPINQGLETCLSTWTEPCTNDWQSHRQVRGAFLLPPNPTNEQENSVLPLKSHRSPILGFNASQRIRCWIPD